MVLYLSTKHENEMETAINKRKVEVVKPLPIVKYNGFMNGVDRSDRMQAYYQMQHETLRLYKKGLVHTIQMMDVNVHYLFNDAFVMNRTRKIGLQSVLVYNTFTQ